MFVRKLQIRLPRRITAYFLLFGLAALVWLSVGAVYVAHSVTDSRSESASLRSLGRASDRVVLAYLRNKDADLQPLLAEIRAQSGADYCAVVSPTGEYLAHSNRGADRQDRSTERGGTHRSLGRSRARCSTSMTTACRFTSTARRLKSAAKSLGTLRLGIAQPSVWSYVRAGLQFAPLAFLGPACCMVAGAVLLNRMVRPVADIEQQLFQVATSPSLESCELREVPGVGAAALGWNRVIQQRFSGRRPTRCNSGSASRSSRAGTAGWTRCSTAFPTASPRPTTTGRLTYTNLPMSVILGLEGRRRRRRRRERRPKAPRDDRAARQTLASAGDRCAACRRRTAIGPS